MGSRSLGGRCWHRGPRPGGNPSPGVEVTFDAIEAGGIPTLAGRAGQEDPRADQLELQARARGTGHLRDAGVDDVGGPREGSWPEPGLLATHPVELVLGDAAEDLGGTVGDRRDDDEVTQPFEEVHGEPPRILAGLDDLVDLREDGAGVARSQRVDGGVEQLHAREAQQRGRTFVSDALVAGARDQLVEDRQRVAHRPAARARDEPQHSWGDGDTLLGGQLLEVCRELGRRDEPERVVVGAGADRADDLLGLGRREDELHVLRRLLDDLQQGVEALRRDHVGLVDDVDLEPALGRAVGRPLAQIARIVDAAVASRVDLDDVDRPTAAPRECDARVARAARRRGRTLLAVEAAREDPGAGRLATPPRAAEEVGVTDPAGAQCLHERLGHVLLPDDVGERLGPVAAIEGGAHGPTLLARGDTRARPQFTHGGEQRPDK